MTKLKLNIYEIFLEHLGTHIINKDDADIELLNNPMSGICPYCKKTMNEVFDETVPIIRKNDRKSVIKDGM